MPVHPFFDTAKERSYAERTLHTPPTADMLEQRMENLAAAMLSACDEIETQRMTLEYVLRHIEHGSTIDRAVVALTVRRTLHYESGEAGALPPSAVPSGADVSPPVPSPVTPMVEGIKSWSSAVREAALNRPAQDAGWWKHAAIKLAEKSAELVERTDIWVESSPASEPLVTDENLGARIEHAKMLLEAGDQGALIAYLIDKPIQDVRRVAPSETPLTEEES